MRYGDSYYKNNMIKNENRIFDMGEIKNNKTLQQ